MNLVVVAELGGQEKVAEGRQETRVCAQTSPDSAICSHSHLLSFFRCLPQARPHSFSRFSCHLPSGLESQSADVRETGARLKPQDELEVVTKSEGNGWLSVRAPKSNPG